MLLLTIALVAVLIALSIPALSIWLQARECKILLALATSPAIYKKLYSTRFLEKIESTQQRYSDLSIKLIPMYFTAVLLSIIVWIAYAAGSPFETWEAIAAAAFFSFEIVFLWSFRHFPVWMYNWKIDLVRTGNQLQLEAIHARMTSLQQQITAMEEPKDPIDMLRVETIKTEIEMLDYHAQSLIDNSNALPEHVKE